MRFFFYVVVPSKVCVMGFHVKFMTISFVISTVVYELVTMVCTEFNIFPKTKFSLPWKNIVQQQSWKSNQQWCLFLLHTMLFNMNQTESMTTNIFSCETKSSSQTKRPTNRFLFAWEEVFVFFEVTIHLLEAWEYSLWNVYAYNCNYHPVCSNVFLCMHVYKCAHKHIVCVDVLVDRKFNIVYTFT